MWLRRCLFAVCLVAAVTADNTLRFHPAAAGATLCLDQKGTCPPRTTCCKLASGDYGCCQHPQATCCRDGEHCCPFGYNCDIKAGKCTKASASVSWVSMVKSQPVASPQPASPPRAVLAAAPAAAPVVCPDKKATCPEGTTCCLIQPAQYGCCPIAEAVCCSDHKHCCPQGTTCDPAEGRCNKGLLRFPIFTKFPATPIMDHQEDKTNDQQQQPRNEVQMTMDLLNEIEEETEESPEDIVCPDKESSCPAHTTCCKLQDGYYGCCPMENAVCCSDHQHCCPNGETCNLAKGTCDGADGRPKSPLQTKLRARPVAADIMCPDNISTCPPDTTCCEMQSGYYGCCPIKNAICCKNKLHCCAADQECDEEKGTCVSPTTGATSPAATKTPAAAPRAGIICPDKKSQCTQGTCCIMASGQYGCCPWPAAECCTDHIHCCPENTQCDLAQQRCVSEATGAVLPWSEKQPATPVSRSNGVCPDQKSSCPDGSTCCQLKSGAYGCCPEANAVCCSDHIHCCPENMKCDVAQQRCTDGALSVPWSEKQPATPVSRGNGVCPDQKSSCPDGSTCCQLKSGAYGCCPEANAVCCSDHIHCCPENMKCDVAQQRCLQSTLVMPWMEKQPAASIASHPPTVGDIVCPDKKSSCSEDETCCQLNSGAYACCPAPNAVCCPDHKSCCPENTKCDVEQQMCVRSQLSLPWMEKQPAMVRNARPDHDKEDIVCPDQTSSCPDGSTCCQLESGAYGCCPQPNAVCCSDHIHCCPENTKCDVAQQRCTNGVLSVSWSEKQRAMPISANKEDIVCPDQTSSCPDGSTCCQLESGAYGCCPQPNAVCCSDHIHCCPENTQCDVEQQRCLQSTLDMPWMEKQPAASIASHPPTAGDVVCPDKTSSCPDGSTCCQLESGAYGCCPQPNAVCCSDHIHCCPENTKCDVAQQKCLGGLLSLPWMEKQPAAPIASHPPTAGDVVCPDKTSSCPDGSTCCQLESGAYGCCPQPNAVCCSDHIQCCPENTQCDVAQQKCLGGLLSLPWMEKQPAMVRNAKPDSQDSQVGLTTRCGDGSTCGPTQTCCLMTSGRYGCCPYPQAACCRGHNTCCKMGYLCDSTGTMCNPSNGDGPSVPAAQIQAGVSEVLAPAVTRHECPDQRGTCGDSETCCLMPGGEYGCCPYQHATCCPDKKTCCNHGYTCNEVTKMCDPTPLPAAPISGGVAAFDADFILDGPVVCPGGQMTCPAGQTCCKLTTGQQGCCPRPDAVCCDGHDTCCPQGYTCDSTGTMCNPGNGARSVPAATKTPALPRAASLRPAPMVSQGSVDDTICPDSSSCPGDDTCCMMSGGKYGCCPLAGAVCCSDQQHCCPQGYTCGPMNLCIPAGAPNTWLPAPVTGPQDSAVGPLLDLTPPLGDDVVAMVTRTRCGDHDFCPDGAKCCSDGKSRAGCCPLSDGVCCADFEHCCPANYKCDLARQRCSKAEDLRETDAEKHQVSEHVCTDKTTCPDSTTCCEQSDGGYACCPHPEAVCCPDKVHCCPKGSTCDTESGKCESRGSSLASTWTQLTPRSRQQVPLGVKVAAETGGRDPDSVMCPDRRHQCPRHSTCCHLMSGQWGCCPFQRAVCCPDHIHCCPEGFTCDQQSGMCLHPEGSMSLSATLFARRKATLATAP